MNQKTVRDATILGLLAWWLWPKDKPEETVDVGFTQTCVYPNGNLQVPLYYPECPYSTDMGGEGQFDWAMEAHGGLDFYPQLGNCGCGQCGNCG